MAESAPAAPQKTQAELEGDRKEREHFVEVLRAFNEYAPYMFRQFAQRKRHLEKTPRRHLERLPGGVQGYQKMLTDLTKGAHMNMYFLNQITSNKNYYQEMFRLRPNEISLDPAERRSVLKVRDAADLGPNLCPWTWAQGRHMSKVKSTLHQCVREWSTEGAEERRQCFGPLLASLEKYLPVSNGNRNKQKVLVPGSGLGRLVLEICARGYATQGNEFDYFMLLTCNLLLNRTQHIDQFSICPWIDKKCNIFNRADTLKTVRFPDICPMDLLSGGGDGDEPHDMSMCAGEFLEVYREHKDKWHAVVTCFFIDTAPNIFEYLDTIYRMLKPGGIWTSIGPLLYHWAEAGGDRDERYGRSIELSYDEIKHAILSYGFEFLHEERIKCKYAIRNTAMMHTEYNTVHFTVRKPVTAPPLRKKKAATAQPAPPALPTQRV